jgi:hypothetical protein
LATAAIVTLTFGRATALALLTAGTHQPDLFTGQLAIAVLVELLESFGGVLNFFRVNFPIVVGVKCSHDWCTHAGLARTAGTALTIGALAARALAVGRRLKFSLAFPRARLALAGFILSKTGERWRREGEREQKCSAVWFHKFVLVPVVQTFGIAAR